MGLLSFNKTLGRRGERLAAKFLKHSGHRILARNVKTPFGEIDLVAREKVSGRLIFVEVKTRTSRKFGSPLYAVTAAKQKSIIANSLVYLKKNRLCDAPARIDIIAIDLDNNGDLKILEYIKNAITL